MDGVGGAMTVVCQPIFSDNTATKSKVLETGVSANFSHWERP